MKEADIFSQKIFREFTRSILFGWTSERFRSAVPKYFFCLLVFYIGAAGASSKSYIVTLLSMIVPFFPIYKSTTPTNCCTIPNARASRLLTTKNHPRRNAHDRETNRNPRAHDERLTHLRPNPDATFLVVFLANVVEVVRRRARNPDGGCLVARFVPPIIPSLTLVVHARPR